MENARIKSTSLGPEGHGIFTAYLHLEGSGWGCGFGGYVLGPHAKAWIEGVLRVAGVDSWERLPGCLIRVEETTCGGRITRITHIMDDSIHFDAAEWQSEAKGE